MLDGDGGQLGTVPAACLRRRARDGSSPCPPISRRSAISGFVPRDHQLDDLLLGRCQARPAVTGRARSPEALFGVGDGLAPVQVAALFPGRFGGVSQVLACGRSAASNLVCSKAKRQR